MIQLCTPLVFIALYKYYLPNISLHILEAVGLIQLCPLEASLSLTLIVVSGRFKAAASSHLRGLDT